MLACPNTIPLEEAASLMFTPSAVLFTTSKSTSLSAETELGSGVGVPVTVIPWLEVVSSDSWEQAVKMLNKHNIETIKDSFFKYNTLFFIILILFYHKICFFQSFFVRIYE